MDPYHILRSLFKFIFMFESQALCVMRSGHTEFQRALKWKQARLRAPVSYHLPVGNSSNLSKKLPTIRNKTNCLLICVSAGLAWLVAEMAGAPAPDSAPALCCLQAQDLWEQSCSSQGYRHGATLHLLTTRLTILPVHVLNKSFAFQFLSHGKHRKSPT